MQNTNFTEYTKFTQVYFTIWGDTDSMQQRNELSRSNLRSQIDECLVIYFANFCYQMGTSTSTVQAAS